MKLMSHVLEFVRSHARYSFFKQWWEGSGQGHGLSLNWLLRGDHSSEHGKGTLLGPDTFSGWLIPSPRDLSNNDILFYFLKLKLMKIDSNYLG